MVVRVALMESRAVDNVMKVKSLFFPGQGLCNVSDDSARQHGKVAPFSPGREDEVCLFPLQTLLRSRIED